MDDFQYMLGAFVIVVVIMFIMLRMAGVW